MPMGKHYQVDSYLIDPKRQYRKEENDEVQVFIRAKIERMLERKIDLWPPEEIFDILPILMKVSK